MNIGAVLNPWGPSSIANPLKSHISGARQWDLESVFGRNVTRPCPATQQAALRVLREDPTKTNPENDDDSSNNVQSKSKAKSKSKSKSKGKGGNEEGKAKSKTILPDPIALYHSKHRWVPSSNGNLRLDEQTWDVLRMDTNGVNMTIVYNEDSGAKYSFFS
jgi:hypothetical protein